MHNSYFNLIDCMFEAVYKYLGYGMATLIYNNLLNLFLGTVMFIIIIFRRRLLFRDLFFVRFKLIATTGIVF